MTRNDSPPRTAVVMMVSGAVYLAVEVASAALMPENPDPLWLPAGLGLALMLLWGRRIWPSLAAASAVFALLPHPWGLGASLWPGLALSLIGVGEAALATTLISRKRGFDPDLSTLFDVRIFVLWGMLIPPLMAALAGSGLLVLSGLIEPSGFGLSAWAWYAGDVLGIACGAPIVMTSGSWRLPSREGRASHAEAVLAVLGFTALSVYIFFVGKVPISGSFPYPVYPFVVWVALRMGPPVVSLLTPILAAIAVAATRAGAGPFTDGEAFTRIGRAQTFVVILALTGMTLAAAVRERASVSAERAWLADVTDRSLNEIYVFDPSTLRFEYFNAGARANTGYTPEKIREMTPIDIKPEFDERSFRALIAPLLEGSTRQLRFETIHLRADGTTYPVEVYLQLVDRGGRPVFVALINDISQRRQTEVALAEYRDHLEGLVDERTEELQQANEELEVSNEELHSLYEDTAEAAEELARLNREVEEASRAKSDFLANMSHELRTPLNSIIGFSDILLHGLAGPLTKEQARQVAMINDSGKHLLDLINDVLDLSKIEAERMEPVFEVCDLSAVTRQVVESVEPQAHEKGLYLEWSGLDCQTPVLTDATMVRQIVLNLLSNALKFTQRGGIRVGLTLEEGWCRISVSDTGPGIADADRRRIFESFTQLPAANGGRPDGTGLGLSISARLAGLLGGRIELTNAAERGSTFTVVLPTQ